MKWVISYIKYISDKNYLSCKSDKKKCKSGKSDISDTSYTTYISDKNKYKW